MSTMKELKEIKKELSEIGMGTFIICMKKRSLNKQCGFLILLSESSFTIKENENEMEILYEEVTNIKIKEISITMTKGKATYYPIKIGEVIVYYARNKSDMERYLLSSKYMRMAEWYNLFESKKMESLKEYLMEKLLNISEVGDDDKISSDDIKLFNEKISTLKL